MSVIFDEPVDMYHANAALGSTDIRDYLRSPRLFRDRQDGLAQKETPALLFGTASHMALLEPSRYLASVAMKPEGMSFATKEGKAWRDEHAGKIIVRQEDHEHLHHMQLRMPSEVREIFMAGQGEVTVRTQLHGLAVQCRADWWNVQTMRVYDLKTIDAIENVERAIYKHGYHIQAAWYRRVIAAQTTDGALPRFAFIFAEKNPPYRWRLVELDPDYQALGEQAIDDALHGIIARNKSGCWDDPKPLHMVACPPEWLNDITETDEGISL